MEIREDQIPTADEGEGTFRQCHPHVFWVPRDPSPVEGIKAVGLGLRAVVPSFVIREGPWNPLVRQISERAVRVARASRPPEHVGLYFRRSDVQWQSMQLVAESVSPQYSECVWLFPGGCTDTPGVEEGRANRAVLVGKRRKHVCLQELKHFCVSVKTGHRNATHRVETGPFRRMRFEVFPVGPKASESEFLKAVRQSGFDLSLDVLISVPAFAEVRKGPREEARKWIVTHGGFGTNWLGRIPLYRSEQFIPCLDAIVQAFKREHRPSVRAVSDTQAEGRTPVVVSVDAYRYACDKDRTTSIAVLP